MKICTIFSRKKSIVKRSFFIRVKAREGGNVWYYRKLEDWEIMKYTATSKISIFPWNSGAPWSLPCTRRVTLGNMTTLNAGSLNGFFYDTELERSGFATLPQLVRNGQLLQAVA